MDALGVRGAWRSTQRSWEAHGDVLWQRCQGRKKQTDLLLRVQFKKIMYLILRELLEKKKIDHIIFRTVPKKRCLGVIFQ
jgi:MarR-like DNA-binding transcriptional regulator SgrR of sgrS sRNA